MERSRREMLGWLTGATVVPVAVKVVPIPPMTERVAMHAPQVRVLDSSKPWVLVSSSYNIADHTVTGRYRDSRTGEVVLHAMLAEDWKVVNRPYRDEYAEE